VEIVGCRPESRKLCETINSSCFRGTSKLNILQIRKIRKSVPLLADAIDRDHSSLLTTLWSNILEILNYDEIFEERACVEERCARVQDLFTFP